MNTLSNNDITLIILLMEHYFFGQLEVQDNLIVKSFSLDLAQKLLTMVKELNSDKCDRKIQTEIISDNLDNIIEAIEMKLLASEDWNAIADLRSLDN